MLDFDTTGSSGSARLGDGCDTIVHAVSNKSHWGRDRHVLLSHPKSELLLLARALLDDVSDDPGQVASLILIPHNKISVCFFSLCPSCHRVLLYRGSTLLP